MAAKGDCYFCGVLRAQDRNHVRLFWLLPEGIAINKEIEKMAFGFESPVWVRDTRADSWGEFEKSGHSFRREIIGQAAVIGYVPIRRFPMSDYAYRALSDYCSSRLVHSRA
jgi:hypothetical protein